MVVPVVMQVEHPVQLGVACHVQVLRCLQAFTDGLSRIFLHLDIVEFPAKTENNTLVKRKNGSERE